MLTDVLTSLLPTSQETVLPASPGWRRSQATVLCESRMDDAVSAGARPCCLFLPWLGRRPCVEIQN